MKKQIEPDHEKEGHVLTVTQSDQELYGLSMSPIITKTYLHNFDHLKPHFYIVKLGFTGVYIIFLFLLINIDCGYLLELPRQGGSNEYPQYMFWAEIWKISAFLTWKFSVFGGEIFYIFEQACFRIGYPVILKVENLDPDQTAWISYL